MSKRNLDRSTALSTTDIHETLVIGPREFQCQRLDNAHAEAGHGGQELFQSSRSVMLTQPATTVTGPEVRRAKLVRLPAPRAQLARLPTTCSIACGIPRSLWPNRRLLPHRCRPAVPPGTERPRARL